MRSQKLGKISDFYYLHAKEEKVHAYRALVRILFEAHEQYEPSQSSSEIYRKFKELYPDEAYSEDECRIDLDKLELLGNLDSEEDKRLQYSLVDFKRNNKKYFITSETKEIERFVLTLEDAKKKSMIIHEGDLRHMAELIKSASEIIELNPVDTDEGKRIIKWWEDLSRLFNDLQRKAVDSGNLYKSKIDELIKNSDAFEMYKDKVLELLRDFTRVLMDIRPEVERAVILYEELQNSVCVAVIQAQMEHDINYMDADFDVELIKIKTVTTNHVRWIKGNESFGLQRVLRNSTLLASNLIEIINEKINRSRSWGNRAPDLFHMADVFHHVNDVNEAHEIFAHVFGATQSRCYKLDHSNTVSQFESAYDEKPTVFIYERKQKKKPTKNIDARQVDHEERNKRKVRREEQKRRLKAIVNGLVKENRIDFSDINEVPLEGLNALVEMVSHARQSRNEVPSQYGFSFIIKEYDPSRRVVIQSGEGVYNTAHTVLEVTKYHVKQNI
jgi:uncharacterized protein (TIGR02677 family)